MDDEAIIAFPFVVELDVSQTVALLGHRTRIDPYILEMFGEIARGPNADQAIKPSDRWDYRMGFRFRFPSDAILFKLRFYKMLDISLRSGRNYMMGFKRSFQCPKS